MQKNNIIDFHAIKYISDREALLRYADATPIMPKDMQDKVKDHYSQGTCIQNYAVQVTTQAAVKLPDLGIGDITPIQKDASTHANEWLNNVDKEVMAVFPATKQYTNLITTFDGNDIENLINELASGTARGKEDFKETIDAFKQGADQIQQEITKLTKDLSQFKEDIASDKGKFDTIDDKATVKYNADTGEMGTLKKEMDALNSDIHKCNGTIAVGVILMLPSTAAIAVGVIGGRFVGPLAWILTGVGIFGVAAGVSLLAAALVELEKDIKNYGTLLSQYDTLQTTCSRLRAVGNQFQSLSTSNVKAVQATQNLITGWSNIATNLGVIKGDMDEIIQDANLQFIVKKLLKKFIKDAKDLGDIVKKYEEVGILPVKSDQQVWNLLHQGRRRVPALPSQPLPLDEYLALVRRRNLLGFN